MTTIEIELPETTAQAARAAGLLTPQALARLLDDTLQRRQAEVASEAGIGASHTILNIVVSASMRQPAGAAPDQPPQ